MGCQQLLHRLESSRVADDLLTLVRGPRCKIEVASLPCECMGMAIAKSKLTAQGQISVPAEIRQRLGIGLGFVLEWDEQDNQVIVRRAGRYSSDDVHRALFPEGALSGPPPDTKEAIREYIRRKHARR